MIDPELLAYDHDEERDGFGRPDTPAAPHPPAEDRVPGSARAALALAGLGLVSLVVQASGGPLAGTWLGLATSFGALAAGLSLFFWLAYRRTEPGIRHDGLLFRSLLSQGALAWVAGVVLTAFYVLIYWFPETLGHRDEGHPVGLVNVVDPLAHALAGGHASQWFLYGVLYTLAIVVFGVRMLMKYRHSRYHLVRTASVMFFQVGFAWILPNLLVLLRYPYMEFNGVWPLKQDYLWPDKVAAFGAAGAVGVFLLAWAVALVVLTPVLTYFLGKRWYCSWVCGCGGLAETAGDPWRHLSSKSTAAWKLERWLVHSVLVVVLLVTAVLWADHAWGVLGGASERARQWYGFYIGALFAGVAGVGFYPLLGSRVWCRFGCPQAAILGLWQRAFSRFRITTNGGQCMSCGNCSTYCEMGIDVRAYAQRGANVVRASCVGCGVCAAVCPRGVLRLENGATHADRFANAERPVRVLVESLSEPHIHGYEAWRGADGTPPREDADEAPSQPADAPRPAGGVGAGA